MYKKALLPIIGLALTGVVALGVAMHANYATEPQLKTFQVDFFNNYLSTTRDGAIGLILIK